MHINDILVSADKESEIMPFSHDCVCYRAIKDKKDTLKFQIDIDAYYLGSWVRKLGMRFQPVKCNRIQLTNKLTSKIQASLKTFLSIPVLTATPKSSYSTSYLLLSSVFKTSL